MSSAIAPPSRAPSITEWSVTATAGHRAPTAAPERRDVYECLARWDSWDRSSPGRHSDTGDAAPQKGEQRHARAAQPRGLEPDPERSFSRRLPGRSDRQRPACHSAGGSSRVECEHDIRFATSGSAKTARPATWPNVRKLAVALWLLLGRSCHPLRADERGSLRPDQAAFASMSTHIFYHGLFSSAIRAARITRAARRRRALWPGRGFPDPSNRREPRTDVSAGPGHRLGGDLGPDPAAGAPAKSRSRPHAELFLHLSARCTSLKGGDHQPRNKSTRLQP